MLFPLASPLYENILYRVAFIIPRIFQTPKLLAEREVFFFAGRNRWSGTTCVYKPWRFLHFCVIHSITWVVNG